MLFLRWKPKLGMRVCTCRMTHETIIEIDDDGDTIITLDDDNKLFRCSFRHCCDDVKHSWNHEEVRARVLANWP